MVKTSQTPHNLTKETPMQHSLRWLVATLLLIGLGACNSTTLPDVEAPTNEDSSQVETDTQAEQVSSFEQSLVEAAPAASAPTENNLQPQLAQTNIPIDDIVTLLPRDAIPAILPNEVNVIMVTAEQANEDGMWPSVPVMGISINDEHHAYPLPYLSRHEIVNAEVGGRLIAATW